MDKESIVNLSMYRLEQACENLEEAKILFDNKKFKGANNRAYYAIFHAIKSVLALEEVDFKKHSVVLAYFNKNYINTEIFPRELGKLINKASFIRENSDYVDFYIVSKEDAEKQLLTAEKVIKNVEEYIKRGKYGK